MAESQTHRTVSRLLVYPVELTATQTRESADGPWGPIRFTLLFEGRVQAELDQEAAKLYAGFITATLRSADGAPVTRDPDRFAKPSADERPAMPDTVPEQTPITLIRPMISQARAARNAGPSGS